MLVVSGTILVLLTWGVLLALVIGFGLLPAALVNARAPRTQLLRHALWWGVALGSIIIVGLGLFLPLASPAVGIAFVTMAILFGSAGYLVARRRGFTAGRTDKTPPWVWWTVVAALALAQVTFAIAALGPVTNYDTGLYHLNAIGYGRDFATLPGLANLYGPLGYATIEFPWASALSSAPWGPEGFRLVNGFFMAAVAFDLALRLRGPRRVGSLVLLVGTVAVWGPMLGMADFWVTSPTQDAAALALSLIIAAYVSDAIAGKKFWIADAAIAVVTGIVLIAVRPTFIVFVLATVALTVLLMVRRRPDPRAFGFSALFLGIAAVAMALVLGARDYVLSGWLGYPLSFYAFDVPWLAADPTPLREATLGFHRNPADAAAALGNWAWIPDWFARIQHSWEIAALAVLAVAFVITVFLARMQGSHIPWRRIVFATSPAALAVAVWFVASPPAFRFIWGPLFLVIAIPLGWLLFSRPRFLSSTVVLMIGAGVIAGAAIATLGVRIEWSSMTVEGLWKGVVPVRYAVTPVKDAPTIANELPSGLVIQVPAQTDQCWANYPLCSPAAPQTLTFLDGQLSGGFVQ